MLEVIPVTEVQAGYRLNFEYAPGREADALVNRVQENSDGSLVLHYARFGPVGPYNSGDMVLRVG